MLELTQHEHGVQCLRVGQPAAPAGPSMALPVLVGADDEFEGIQLVLPFQQNRLEAVGDVRGRQLALQSRQLARQRPADRKSRR